MPVQANAATRPEGSPDDNHSCRHRPRSSRTHRMTSFLPEPIPGFPIPLNFAKGLVVLTGRTRIPFLSLSNSGLSPGPTPSTRRTSRGTVIWPLLVILACLSNASPFEIPYFIIGAPYFETAAGRWVGARNKLKADCAFGLSRLMSVLRLMGVSRCQVLAPERVKQFVR
jgi:hypothetical protein